MMDAFKLFQLQTPKSIGFRRFHCFMVHYDIMFPLFVKVFKNCLTWTVDHSV